MNEYTLEISLYTASAAAAIAALHTALLYGKTPLQILAFEIGFLLFILIAYVSIKIGD